jgi:thiol-disulfide isomerase/thioredoxin
MTSRRPDLKRFSTAAAFMALFMAACQPVAGVKGAEPVTLESLKTGEFAELDLTKDLALPTSPMLDSAGATRTLSEFAGKVVVLNIWAEWCAPCVEEMPTLAALQKAFPDDAVAVVPVAFGYPEARQSAEAKLRELAGDALPFFYDPSYNVTYDAKTGAFPSTIIYRPDGSEAARLVLPADWASDEAKAIVQAVLDGAV